MSRPRDFATLYHGTAAAAAAELDLDGAALATPSEHSAALVNALKKIDMLEAQNRHLARQLEAIRQSMTKGA
jgi:hypothetical protein